MRSEQQTVRNNYEVGYCRALSPGFLLDFRKSVSDLYSIRAGVEARDLLRGGLGWGTDTNPAEEEAKEKPRRLRMFGLKDINVRSNVWLSSKFELVQFGLCAWANIYENTRVAIEAYT